MWVKSVRLEGVELDLDAVLASVTIRHGRARIYDPPTASTCSLILQDLTRDFTRSLEVGADLAIDLESAPGSDPPVNRTLARFRGRVTDATLTDPTLNLIGAGRLAELRRAGSVDTTGWPLERWSVRVGRLLAAAGDIPYQIVPDPLFDPELDPPPEAELAIGGYLDELADTVGAAVYDDGAGAIVVEAIGARATPGRVTVSTDPYNVLYSPVWQQELDIVNSVTVLYGPDRQTSATVSDPVSADRYGSSRTEIPTTIHDVADAQQRAQKRLELAGYARWNMQPVTLLDASPAPFQIGHAVLINDLPASAPFPSWKPFLEGWTDLIDGPSFQMQLIVSDPLASHVYPTWETITQSAAWLDTHPELAWQDVIYDDIVTGLAGG